MTKTDKKLWIRRFIIIFLCMSSRAGLALADLVYFGGKDHRSTFEKIRIRCHFEYYTNISFFPPLVGPFRQIHHMG